MTDIDDYLERFRARVIQDALAEATSSYWLRRAEAFEWAAPRPGDFTGGELGGLSLQEQRAGAPTPQQLADAAHRCAAIAQACRARAAVALIQDDTTDHDVLDALQAVA